MYPYNYITRDDAQELSIKMNYENYTSSLMFSIQWDLILKFIETKKVATDPEIKSKLTSEKGKSIGNYFDSEFLLNRGKFAPYSDLSNWYNFNNDSLPLLVNKCAKQPQLSNSNAILLTTGASDSANLQNIYDIAGNVWEWTLDFYSENYQCIARGSSYNNSGSANDSYIFANDYAKSHIGFRIALWKT